MGDDLGAVPEHYVTDSDGSSFLFSSPNVGVLIAVHCEEEGATDEPGSGQFLWAGGHCQSSVMEDYWWEFFSMLGGWVVSLVPVWQYMWT